MVMRSRIIRQECGMRDAQRALEVTHIGKKTLGRPWCKLEDNIKIGLTEYGGVHYIHLAPSGSGREQALGCENMIIRIRIRIP
jgi:hypothetical protein